GVGSLDFVSAWYAKATAVMQSNSNIRAALVSTNSITQGEQVAILWKYLFAQGIVINFAHHTFKWINDAKGVAGVSCVVIGFSLKNNGNKRIFEYADVYGEPNEIAAASINPYLIDAPAIFIENRSNQVSNGPKVNYGSFALDDGNYTLNEVDAEEIIKLDARVKEYIKPFIGGYELINNVKRYCLWLKDAAPNDLRAIQPITARVDRVKRWRSESKRANTLALAMTPTLFAEVRQPNHAYIAFPTVSSEKREYIPIAYLDEGTIASNQLYIINSAELYTFAILTSKMHMAWVGAVCGSLESRYRYSSRLVYNNFIWPEITNAQQADISQLAQNILDALAEFPDASLADLYDPLTMPPVLARAHKTLDRAVDKLYSSKHFASDAERVAMLFEKYQQAVKD
ncbi:MAG: type IIL restriction-modification enzyme MmeI, partial [Candidatus Saccharimonadales bacterium]